MLFVVRFAGEPDVRWRALNARNAEEARAQARSLAYGECVEYGSVDPETGAILILGTIGDVGDELRSLRARPTGT
jgi:hypothetical protein